MIKEECIRLFAKKGIVHQRSVPQQNDRVERKHKHLINYCLFDSVSSSFSQLLVQIDSLFIQIIQNVLLVICSLW